MDNKLGPVSFGELYFYSARAALGAGCPYGIAEEFATLSIWLAKTKGKPFEMLGPALDNIAAKKVETKLTQQTDGRIIHLSGKKEHHLSALYAGVAASDILMMERNNPAVIIHIDKIDFPDLAAACILALTADFSPEISRYRADGSCHPFDLHHAGSSADGGLYAKTPPLPQNTDTCQQSSQAHGCVTLDQSCWEKLQKHFKNSLVPDSAESHRHGAGAGLIDTD